MTFLPRVGLSLWLALLSWLPAGAAPADSQALEAWEAPAAVVVSADGKQLYVACARSQRILVCETTELRVIRTLGVPGPPSGLALAADGRTLHVTCAAPQSAVVSLELGGGKLLKSIPAGHTALAPVLAPGGNILYVCNRFSQSISVLDLKSGREIARIPVEREPVAADITPDGRWLLVANHLHNGRADAEKVAAHVSVIDTQSRKVTQRLELPNGSGLLRGLRVSPDGRYACVTHLVARFQLPTTQVERGWMSSNALTLIDLATLKVVNTVLLDNVESGAATPWACGWSGDGKTLFVTHAGTHEVSLIDFAGLLAKLAGMPESLEGQPTPDYSRGSRSRSEVPNDLAFLTGLRERIKLKGNGPRAAIAGGSRLYVASYFSDSLEVVEFGRQPATPVQFAQLSSGRPMSVLRRGEMLFSDASICLQGWQSCASCHSDDARVDALNWDLLNDGIGNPKNSKSMLFSHRTPPAMSMGVRETAETAVRAGVRNILFTVQPEDVAVAMDEWLKSLTPIPSPYLVKGRLSPSALRGEKLFESSKTRCASCHPKGQYTDLKHYDVGTSSTGEPFDTPTLVEIWRTAPYLHDGSAATLKEVLMQRNSSNRHGHTSHLSQAEIEDLVAYLLSL